MGKKKKQKILWNRVFFAVFILIIIIWVFALFISNIFGKDKKYNQQSSLTDSSQSDNTTNANYDYIEMDSTLINTGDLILVNNDHAYTAPYPTDNEITNVLEFRLSQNNKVFSVKDNTVNVKSSIMSDFNNMMTDFASSTGVKNLILTSGLRTKEDQQKLYDDDLKNNNSAVSTLVALPGHSEHHTGYAIDFSYNDDFKKNYQWLNDNSYKYGFIQRYATDKKDITKIDNEPWHYRYVGQPHAYLMKQNKFCLEEYIDFLKQYTFTKAHLQIKSFGEVSYDVYYVPATEGKTKIPVPKNNDYSISGNNVDGFIITVKLVD